MSKYNNQVDFFTKTRIWENKVKKSQIRGTFYYIDTYKGLKISQILGKSLLRY